MAATTGLAHYRQRKGLSQRKLAAAIGIPQDYISRMESRSMIPTAELLDKLCTILETQPHLIFSQHVLAEVAERAKAKS